MTDKDMPFKSCMMKLRIDPGNGRELVFDIRRVWGGWCIDTPQVINGECDKSGFPHLVNSLKDAGLDIYVPTVKRALEQIWQACEDGMSDAEAIRQFEQLGNSITASLRGRYQHIRQVKP